MINRIQNFDRTRIPKRFLRRIAKLRGPAIAGIEPSLWLTALVMFLDETGLPLSTVLRLTGEDLWTSGDLVVPAGFVGPGQAERVYQLSEETMRALYKTMTTDNPLLFPIEVVA